jgi:hypothetical protein
VAASRYAVELSLPAVQRRFETTDLGVACQMVCTNLLDGHVDLALTALATLRNSFPGQDTTLRNGSLHQMVTEPGERTLDEPTWSTMLASCLGWVQKLTQCKFRHGCVGRETKVPHTAERRRTHEEAGKPGKPKGGHSSFVDTSWMVEGSTTLVLVEVKLDTAGTADQQGRAYATRFVAEQADAADSSSVEHVEAYMLVLRPNGDFIDCTLIERYDVPAGGGVAAAAPGGGGGGGGTPTPEHHTARGDERRCCNAHLVQNYTTPSRRRCGCQG